MFEPPCTICSLSNNFRIDQIHVVFLTQRVDDSFRFLSRIRVNNQHTPQTEAPTVHPRERGDMR